MCVGNSCPNLNRPACPKCEKCRKSNPRIRGHIQVTTANCKMCSILKQMCKYVHTHKLRNNTEFCKECMHSMSDDDTYAIIWRDNYCLPATDSFHMGTLRRHATQQYMTPTIKTTGAVLSTNLTYCTLVADIRACLCKLQNGRLRSLLRTLYRYTTAHYSHSDLITIFTYLMKSYESRVSPHIIADNVLYMRIRELISTSQAIIIGKLADDIMLYLVWCVLMCMCP